MINFVVVEDNKAQRENIKQIIINYMMHNNIEFDIKLFETETKEFLEFIKKRDSYNIYILDFDLPNTNAINVARKIRNTDWDSPIIVYTINGGMALETFKQRLQILDFVNKQYMGEENLNELFTLCLKQFNVKEYLRFTYKNIDYNIDTNRIIYIYRDTIERKCIIKTNNKDYKTSLNLTDLKNKLKDNFVYSHKSCIVNKNHIESIDWNNLEITFDNNMSIEMLSKTHKKDLEL